MQLKIHLLLNIVLVALSCLMTTAGYVLYQADKQSKLAIQVMAESLDKQLEMQLLRIDIGFGAVVDFPDLDFWQETHTSSGICVRFTDKKSHKTRGICQGDELPLESWPNGFERMYELIFKPGLSVQRNVSFNNRVYGVISVLPSAEKELAYAWASVSALMKVSIMTVLAVCLLVYISISRALRPAQTIIDALETMSTGDLSVRLPQFDVLEWQRTGDGINKLAANQQQLLSERKKLVVQLMTLQEEERRYLARELHDELGQCLAAINAHAMSIAYSAEQQCPELVVEANKISHINQRIMDTIRELLKHLRPIELDNSDLATSLTDLIAEWNVRTGDRIHYQLVIIGHVDQLSDAIMLAIFRIIQECLTNVAKHSTATNAIVTLERLKESITVMIEDNGNTESIVLNDKPGIGLLGIRERVSALAGQLMIQQSATDGFIVRIILPTQF